MKMPDTPFTSIDWDALPCTQYPGEVGVATWRTYSSGGLRMRMIDYSPGYVADHWCDRGHVTLVLKGSVLSELADGRKVLLNEKCGYVVSDFGDAAHRSSSKEGATLFIVD